ncbi:hypothetical protein HanPSC8_Chr13g0558631 [Helianthus annuus]|nr:hypothetical protein HanIR_Chr13g0631791 [Helianthus annuus]KAJ0848535.1 hypothetical protein HanPSC8_Chr13g0558631 [Helianthus annuus]
MCHIRGCQLVIYCIQWMHVDGLPKGEFWTEEGDEYEGLGLGERCKLAVCCKKHYWKWVDEGSGSGSGLS